MKRLLLNSKTFTNTLSLFEPKEKASFFSKKILFSLIFAFYAIGLQAATITSTATGGAWATGSTWIGGVAPATGDTVIIATTGAGSVNIAANLTQTAAGSVTINNGAVLTTNTTGVTVTFGSLTIASGGTVTLRRTTTILGATNITGRINFGSTSASVRTITFTGAVTLNAGAVWDETNGGTSTVANTYVFSNNLTNNATTFTPVTASPHNFNGAGTLSGTTTTAMPNVTFTAAYTNNGILTSSTLLTVTGVTLTNNGTITATAALSGSGGVTQGTTGILNIAGASTITTLTATAAGNTVNYTGAAQNIHTGNYSNLNFSGSGAKTLATGTNTIGALSLSGTATTTTVINLTITNNLTINTGTTFTTGTAFTLTVGGATNVTGSLVLASTGTKTFTGDVTLNTGGVWNETGVATINYGGALTNNATTFTANTGGHNFTGASKIISGGTTTSIPTATFTGAYTVNSVFTSATLLTITGVTVTNNSTMTAATSLAGTGTLTQGATALLNIGGAISLTTLNASAAGNTVNYTGATQTARVTTYSNLTLSGTLAKTFATAPTVNAVLSMEGTATISIAPTYGTSATLQYNTASARTAGVEWITPFVATGGIIIKNTGAITTPGVVQIGNNTNVPLNINAGATLTPGANLITFHGDFINAGTLTSGSGGVTIGGTVTPQAIAGFTTTGTVTLAKTAGTATLGANVNGGPLTINGAGGTLNLGVGFTHTFTGIVTLTAGTLNGGSSTLNENAVSATAWTGTGSAFVPATSTVNFGAAGNQTIAANSSFYNLALSNSGTKTFSNATTINNNLAMSGTAVANLGTGLTHTAVSLSFNGAAQVIGTWGSTGSTALNKNATWFGTTATGTINISCVSPSAPTSGGNQTICAGATIPALTASVGIGQVVDWYNQSSGGTLLASGTTSYTPSGAGTFFAETRVSATGCLSATRTGVTLTVNPLPTVLSLTGSTICASPGGNGTIASTTSAVGVNYQLYNSSNVAVQTAKAGTGSALTWSTLAAGTGYYVIGTIASTGCPSTSATVNVATNANPTALVLTGSTICTTPGGDGTITSSTSQTGVDYQLYNSSNVAVQATQPGTGSTLTWDTLTAGTGYYVKGVNATTGCISSNSNAVNVANYTNPIALVVTGSTICASPGGNGTITSTTSVVGVDYQLNDNLGNDVGAAIPGTGAALIFTGLAAGTGYYVDGTNTTTGCISVASNAVDILTNANPSNKTITVSLASVCSGTGANVIVAGSLASETYQLRNNTGNINIGSPVTGNGASLNLPTGNLSTATTFNVLVTTTATGCTSVMTTTPTITITPNNTAGAASSTPTLCINTALTAITHTTTGATGIGTATGLPAGVTAAWASNTITISGTPTVAGTFNYSIPLTGGCGTVNATGTIIVTPNNTAGTASSSPTLCINTALTAITHTTTGATGIGTATGLPAGVTAAWASNTITISGTPTVAGTFTYTIPLTGGCGTVNATGTIIVDPASVGGSVAAAQTICYGTEPADITVTGYTGSVIKWQSASDAAFTTPIDILFTSDTLDGLTIGALTADTYFRAVVQSGTCASANSVAVLITVDALSVGGTVSADQTICSGTQPAAVTVSGHTGSVIKWETSIDAAFTSPTDIFVTTTTLPGTTIGTLTQDTYIRAVVQNGSCGTAESSAVLITVNDPSVGGSIGGSTAVCAGSTSGLLTLSGYTGSILRWEYAVAPFTTWTNIVNTTNTYTSGTLTQTTQFRAVVQNGSCASTTSAVATITIGSTTWSITSWSNGTPDATKAAIISDSFISTGSFNACSLTVNNGASVVISSGDTVNLSGPITILPGCFVVFNNNANLIQSGTTNANTGNLVIKRNSSALKRQDYTIWSTPVSNQQLAAFSPQTLTNRFYTYNTNTNLYDQVATPSATIFNTAQGYLIRMPNNHPTTATIWTGQFVGVPNNGNYSYTLVNGGAGQRFNLVGNPYPSPIDATAFIGDTNNNSTITGTLYFWRKTNNALSPTYCTWNLGGFVSNGEAQVFNPNDVIQTGQGFFVEGTGNGTVNFTNSMRIDNHANQFFKSSNANATATTTIERNRIWLNATNDAGLFSQTMVGYMTNATLGVDSTLDGKYINDGDIALTSLIDTTPYAIQARALPFDPTDIVPMQFKAATAGQYTIAIDHVDGLFTANQDVYLRDNLTGAITNLNTASYSFATESGTFASRFEILYQMPLGYVHPVFTSNQVIVYKNNTDEIVVNAGNVEMNTVKVFDVRGRLLEVKSAINASQTTLKGGTANEVLLVQVTAQDGSTVTKKVIR